MEENVRLLAVNRDVGCGAFSYWIGRRCDILILLVFFARLGSFCLDSLGWVSLCIVRAEIVELTVSFCKLALGTLSWPR